LTESGQGLAYITDSSPEGQNALVVVDLGTGEAWRRLMNLPSVSPTQGFVFSIWGEVVYSNGTTGMPISNVDFGADGIALSPDGKTLWYSTTGGRELYSVPTEYLRDRSPYAELRSQANVRYHTQKGLTDGMETDSNGLVYAGNMEDNAIIIFDPATEVVSTFSRDPRYSWTDTFAVANDGYIYFTENQLWLGAAYWGGVDRRKKPYVLFRCKLPGNGTKITQPAPGGGNSSSYMTM
jgi:sugar lactone lactonase YvrE